MKDDIIYEQPLNERIRNFLCLEYLFQRLDYHSAQDNPWDSRVAVTCLLEVLNFISRSDIKKDIMKGLQQYSNSLDQLKKNPNTDIQKLDKFSQDMYTQLKTLYAEDLQLDKELAQSNLLKSMQQRVSVPGGTCNFDLPELHHWSHQPIECRRLDLVKWRESFSIIYNALVIILFMLRNSTLPTIEQAEAGFYQQLIEKKLVGQLIRVFLPQDSNYFPEISGSKHRFTIYFMEQLNAVYSAKQTKDTVEFELHFCAL